MVGKMILRRPKSDKADGDINVGAVPRLDQRSAHMERLDAILPACAFALRCDGLDTARNARIPHDIAAGNGVRFGGEGGALGDRAGDMSPPLCLDTRRKRRGDGEACHYATVLPTGTPAVSMPMVLRRQGLTPRTSASQMA